jgi:hypothetical protein
MKRVRRGQNWLPLEASTMKIIERDLRDNKIVLNLQVENVQKVLEKSLDLFTFDFHFAGMAKRGRAHPSLEFEIPLMLLTI